MSFQAKSYSQLNALAALVSQQLQPNWIEDNQWPEIVDLACQQGLAPMLTWAIEQAGDDPAANPHWHLLTDATQETGRAYALLDIARVELDCALVKAGIHAIWLKGIALAHTVYPQPWLRPMVDLDVLIPDDQRQIALRTVELLGFLQPNNPGKLDLKIPEDLRHHYLLKGGVGNQVTLELHYRLLGIDGLELLPREQLDWFWGNRVPWQDESGSIEILKPEAHFLYLCAHAVLQHGEANLGLIHYFDLHLLTSKAALDWQIMIDKAIELNWSYAVERALSLTIEYFNSPVPEGAIHELRSRRSCEETEFRVTRFQGKGLRAENALLLFSNLTPIERLQAMKGILFPSKAYMKHHYAIRDGRSVFPYYLYRWFDEARELTWALRNRLTNRTERNV